MLESLLDDLLISLCPGLGVQRSQFFQEGVPLQEKDEGFVLVARELLDVESGIRVSQVAQLEVVEQAEEDSGLVSLIQDSVKGAAFVQLSLGFLKKLSFN